MVRLLVASLKMIEINLSIALIRLYKTFLKSLNPGNVKENQCIVSIGNQASRGVENRAKVYFKYLSQAEVNAKFSFIEVKSYMPIIVYLIKLGILHKRYNLNIILIDFHYKTRFPHLTIVRELIQIFPFSCIWFETFEASNIKERVNPTLGIIKNHFISDDPSLRIKKMLVDYLDTLNIVFFPFPVFPQSFYLGFNESERTNDLCFYGAIGNASHHDTRRIYLEGLQKSGFEVFGYLSETHKSRTRPAYDSMLQGLRSSKIGLNFSHHGGLGVVTNRVYETIVTGAVLFSTDEEVLKLLLTPGRDYVVFSNIDDLKNKISGVLRQGQLLNLLSNSASQKMSTNFSAEKFVQLLIESSESVV